MTVLGLWISMFGFTMIAVARAEEEHGYSYTGMTVAGSVLALLGLVIIVWETNP